MMPRYHQGIKLSNVSLNDANHIEYTELLDALKCLSANIKDLAFEIDPDLSSGEPFFSSRKITKITAAYQKNDRTFYIAHRAQSGTVTIGFGGKSKLDILQFTQRILKAMKYGDRFGLEETLEEKIEIAKRMAAERNAQRNNPYAGRPNVGRPNNSKNTLRNEDIDL